MTLVIDSVVPPRPLFLEKIVRDFTRHRYITVASSYFFYISDCLTRDDVVVINAVSTQLRKHGRVSDHVLRKGGNVVWGRWSGAMPLWSESS